VTTTFLTEGTANVLTVNDAVVAPEATVTLVGTVAAAGMELTSFTTAPIGPASPVNDTVPVTVDAEPPTTGDGET
jgi:hypothetical protein